MFSDIAEKNTKCGFLLSRKLTPNFMVVTRT